MTTIKKTFTKVALEQFQSNDKRYFAYDSKIPGLAIQVTPRGAKTFYLVRKFNRKTEKIRIGQFPTWTIEQARRKATELNAMLNAGETPKSKERQGVTVGETFEAYLNTRSQLKDSTVKNYRDAMRLFFSDWKDKPLNGIGEGLIAKRHHALTEEHGKARANLAMRVLSSVCNFALHRYPEALQSNPVRILTHTRAWHRVNRRDRVIHMAELPQWWSVVQEISPLGRDYLVMALLTGLRREELLGLKWCDVDVEGKTLTVRETKNHGNHTLPLSNYLADVLSNRRTVEPEAEFVFTGARGNRTASPQYWIKTVSKASGIEFSSHDLRRTFATIVESLDISAYALKRLLNHKTGIGSDVTSGYVIHDIERLRPAMQRVTDFVLKEVGERPPAEVLDFQRVS